MKQILITLLYLTLAPLLLFSGNLTVSADISPLQTGFKASLEFSSPGFRWGLNLRMEKEKLTYSLQEFPSFRITRDLTIGSFMPRGFLYLLVKPGQSGNPYPETTASWNQAALLSGLVFRKQNLACFFSSSLLDSGAPDLFGLAGTSSGFFWGYAQGRIGKRLNVRNYHTSWETYRSDRTAVHVLLGFSREVPGFSIHAWFTSAYNRRTGMANTLRWKISWKFSRLQLVASCILISPSPGFVEDSEDTSGRTYKFSLTSSEETNKESFSVLYQLGEEPVHYGNTMPRKLQTTQQVDMVFPTFGITLKNTFSWKLSLENKTTCETRFTFTLAWDRYTAGLSINREKEIEVEVTTPLASVAFTGAGVKVDFTFTTTSGNLAITAKVDRNRRMTCSLKYEI